MNDSTPSPMPTHQQRFIDGWITASNRYTALLWPAGAGAISAICAITKRLGPTDRVLVIADRNDLVQQFIHRQQSVAISACAVDRYTYRQLQSAVAADSPNWRGSQIYALSSSLASQSDVANSLQQQKWDLVILLDIPASAIAKFVDDMLTEATRVVWKLRPGSDSSSLDQRIWAIDHVTVSELIRDQGLLEVEPTSTEIRIHAEEPSALELEVDRLIEKIVIASKETSANRLAMSLRTRWLSSPAALESGLRRLESELRTQWPLWDVSVEDAEGDLSMEASSLSAGDSSVALQAVKECISALDGLDNDSKLGNLLNLLRSRNLQQSIGIFVRYRDTGVYLHAALEDERVPCVLVHGAMSAAEINSRMHFFLQQPGQVLVMTTAMLVGADLRAVRNLVLYDARASREGMSQLLAKFHLVGMPQLHVTVIADPLTAAKTADLIKQAGQFVA